MFEGVISGWGTVLTVLLFTHITIISVTLYLHRCQAHRALDLHPALAHFFRAWVWLTTGMATVHWTAVHRLHHARCETKQDPHSPQTQGIWRILLLGVRAYVHAARNQETLERYGKGTPTDWLERNLYFRHQKLGIALMLGIDLVLFGPMEGSAAWLVQMAWIPFWAAGVVNGIGHFWGYRNFDPQDASRNISPWGLIIGGEELHNNHHTYPTSAKFSVRPFEFDLGWMYIRLFERLGLARAKKLPPVFDLNQPQPASGPRLLDNVVAHRFELLAQYAQVLKAIHRRERHLMDGEALRIRRSLWRRLEVLRFYDRDARRLAVASSRSRALYQALTLRTSLIEVWANQKATREESLAHLKAWIASAEASGIVELVGFSRRLARIA